jgi:hypothetical protein
MNHWAFQFALGTGLFAPAVAHAQTAEDVLDAACALNQRPVAE